MRHESAYWDQLTLGWRRGTLWRRHSDAVNADLLRAWLPAEPVSRLLKTDLFDEAVGEGLYPLLARRARQVVGIDVSPATAAAARRNHPGLVAVAADVRRLPFGDGHFDAIVSNSTLDHFGNHGEMARALAELRRVLRPGGLLLLTLDNLANPLIALRARLPFPLLHRLGIVPYYVGVSAGPRRARQLVRQAGFDVQDVTGILHCCRVLAVPLSAWLERHAPERFQRIWLRVLREMEGLESWPTRFLTGHFVALRAAAGQAAVDPLRAAA